MKKCGLIICMATLGFLCSKTALKAAAAEATPWQTYLDKAPVQAKQFAADPLGTLVRLFAAEPVQLLRDTMQQYADVLLFLSLAAGLAFLLQDTADRALLELAAAAVPKALKPLTRMADRVDIRRLRQSREEYVSSLLQITPEELTLGGRKAIARWYEVYGYDDAMVQEAAVQAGPKRDLWYWNSILKTWNAKGLRSIHDVRGPVAAAGASRNIRVDRAAPSGNDILKNATRRRSLIKKPE